MRKNKEWTLYEKEEQKMLNELDIQGYSKKGYIYILEYGNMLKIGVTSKPYSRLKGLSNLAEKYSNVSIGLMAISPIHYNYYENEKRLHNFFSSKRFKNGELFCLTIEEFFDSIEEVKLEYVTKFEDKIDHEKFIENILHLDEKIPKVNKSHYIMYVCWEDEFASRAFYLLIEKKIGVDDFLEGLFSFLNERFDIKKLSNEYRSETNSENFNIYDLCSYFPELRDLANEYLSMLENN